MVRSSLSGARQSCVARPSVRTVGIPRTFALVGGVGSASTAVDGSRSEMLGRDDEASALLAFLEAQLPAAAVLEGEAGIGKTTLFESAAAAARDRGFAVLACRPAESEIQLSFAGLADLLDGRTDEILPRLPRPQGRALRVALLLDEAGGSPPEQHAVAAATLGALRILAQERPVLVAVDDVQWLDPASAAVLEFAVRRLEQPRPRTARSPSTSAIRVGRWRRDTPRRSPRCPPTSRPRGASPSARPRPPTSRRCARTTAGTRP